MLSTNLVLNDDLTWLKEVIDLGFLRTLSNVVIFGWPVSNDQFFPLLIEKILIYHILKIRIFACYLIFQSS